MAIYVSLGPTKRELLKWTLLFPDSLQGLAKVKQDPTLAACRLLLTKPQRQDRLGQPDSTAQLAVRSPAHQGGALCIGPASRGDIRLGLRCTPSRTFFSCILPSHAYLLLPTGSSNPPPQTIHNSQQNYCPVSPPCFCLYCIKINRH